MKGGGATNLFEQSREIVVESAPVVYETPRA
jgi:hypothetical protein